MGSPPKLGNHPSHILRGYYQILVRFGTVPGLWCRSVTSPPQYPTLWDDWYWITTEPIALGLGISVLAYIIYNLSASGVN